MQAFLVSTGVVALAEIGDKTQLLAFVLAARYRRAWPIILGALYIGVVLLLPNGVVGGVIKAFKWVRRFVSKAVSTNPK